MKRIFLGAVLTTACVVGALPARAQLASFDTTTNILTLDSVAVGGQYFSGVAVNLAPGQAWSVVGSPRQISPLSASDAAVYANNQLTVPRTQIGNLTYDNFVLNLPVGSPMSIARQGVVSSAKSPGYNTDIFPIRSKIKNSAETDSGGELTYALTNGQVWKHFIDEPCMPAGIGTSDPDGYSDVEIYPNPGGSGSVAANEGNFRFVTYYPSKAEALLVETCIVTPVSGVFGVSQTSSPNTLAASPTAITGTPGERRNLYITGGTPPYMVIIDNLGLANFWFEPNGAEMGVKLSRAGSGVLTVYDYNRFSTTVSLTVTGQNFYPPSIEGFAEGTEMDVFVLFGSPPYAVTNPLYPHIQVTPIGDANTTNQFRLRLASIPPNSGELKVGFLVTDSTGYAADFSISKFVPDPRYSIELKLNAGANFYFNVGDELNLPITGGRPPYAGRNPNSKIFSSVTAVQDEWGEWVLSVKVRDDYIRPIGEVALPAVTLTVRDANYNTSSIWATLNGGIDNGLYETYK